jgi:hypothetical protein
MRMPVFAEPGAGKSVFLAVLMEELWRLHLQFVCIDPLGTGWGIKTSADGMRAGIAVPYLGGTGRYADAPLRADGGAIVARALVDTGASMMLNLAPFSRSAQNAFVSDLWNELLLLAGRRHESGNPISLLNLIDEAAFFMPEQARSSEQARAQDAGERVARQGRSLGLGFATTTQRGQSLDKDVVGTWEIFVLLRLTDKRAIDAAIREFEHVVGAKQALEIRTSLPHLANGEAWIVAPRSLGFTRRVKLRMRETYDSTRTPAPGERRQAPTSLAQADLTALREALTVAPHHASATVARSERTVRGSAQRITRDERDADAGLLTGALTAAEDKTRSLEHEMVAASSRIAELERDNDALRRQIRAIGEILAGSVPSADGDIRAGAATATTTRPAIARTARTSPVREKTPRRAAQGSDGESETLGPAAMKLILRLVQFAPDELSWYQLATLAGIKASGGYFNTGRQQLRAGYVQEHNGRIRASDKAAEAFAAVALPTPRTPSERLELWCSVLKSPAPEMLRAIVGARAPLTVDELAAQLGKKPTGGYWNTGLSSLRNNELVALEGKALRANAQLLAS